MSIETTQLRDSLFIYTF
ncbi:unnamed protein product [Clonostachys rosea f. rosea IK726]|uniref:Uncharacterized protein n=1 Tax=Clonostachys rosea f. rosea IK726 TaxID=1349383 RepID=A0ACA9TUF5_BIOOC|nr:unnamed protein product [Clonostachys rosea f. rosea IK726]